ncbi:hypothetical protein AMJ71_05060 [candidate division TA06 bacterium SM1_40]|uniref:Outer membrane lipoprotein BamD-like domain-containing protein n=1 Tax=candidate division TA06 bacterium SM1_40 TaxID=1703773 RepID=A0A0S8JJS1_UNCT6|nr:MAG: hypothetical protein AMJ71_05060 [candidate division TA06 bacterium SM1_40]
MASRRQHRKTLVLLFFIGAAIQVPGCAYYNTFYNAKASYTQGMRLKEQSPEGKLSPGAKNHFDKAIEKCAKVIELYPGSRWVDEAVLLMGKCFFEEEEYLKALRKFEEVTIYYSGGKWLDDAYYMMGRTYVALEDYPRATAAFDHSLSIAPEGEWADDATYWKAAANFATEGFSAAASQYRAFLQLYPRSEYYDQALFELAESLHRLGQFEEAISRFSELVDRRPGKKLAFPASLRIGEACLAMGTVERALTTFKALQGSGLEPGEEAKLGLRVGDCHRSLGDYNAALSALDAVVQGHPRTEEAAEASYRMGLIYEEDLSDLEEARKAYEQVRRHAPALEVAFDAAERSTSIAKLTEYRENLATGEEADLAATQFQLAELYYFGLGDVDQAMLEYGKVLADYPESELAPKAAFALAWILEHEKGDEEGARAAYEELTVRFPGTTYAARAEAELRDTPGLGEEGKDVLPLEDAPILEGGAASAENAASNGDRADSAGMSSASLNGVVPVADDAGHRGPS